MGRLKIVYFFVLFWVRLQIMPNPGSTTNFIDHSINSPDIRKDTTNLIIKCGRIKFRVHRHVMYIHTIQVVQNYM